MHAERKSNQLRVDVLTQLLQKKREKKFKNVTNNCLFAFCICILHTFDHLGFLVARKTCICQQHGSKISLRYTAVFWLIAIELKISRKLQNKYIYTNFLWFHPHLWFQSPAELHQCILVYPQICLYLHFKIRKVINYIPDVNLIQGYR